jgi:Uma2 family endonuclease
MPRTHQRLNNARNLRDLLRRLGDIPLERVRLHPPPGTATEEDLLHVLDHENVPCELVDGVLVEKPMGAKESILAGRLIRILGNFVDEYKLGEVGAPDLTLRIMQGLVRLPDVAFISSAQVPGGELPAEPIPELVPELIAEILSRSNTRSEMARKRREFFLTGTQLIWIINPNKRTVEVYTPAGRRVVLTESDTLTGGDVLRGFILKLSDFFVGVPKSPPRSPKKKRKKP